ncbi:MAG: flagellar hook-associated protein FlgK [Alphaproteobacteria bacterium]|jgi:flagellar hook-associated protein 1 FlgK
MMSSGLGLSLSNAISGLRVNQRQISVLSHNIANVNTEGYSRQIVNQSAVYIDNIGSGVEIASITRRIDQYLQRAIIGQQGNTSRTEAIKEFGDRLQILLGEPGSESSIDEFITSFTSAFQNLAETPDKASFRSNALESAVLLAKEVSRLAYGVEDLRFEADREISQAVKNINNTIRELNTVNTGIIQASNTGNVGTDLLDSRDRLVNELSKYLDISVYYEENGQVNVLTSNGVALVDKVFHELRYSPASSADNFVQGQPSRPLQVVTLKADGTQTGAPIDLISVDENGVVSTKLTSGIFKGLQEVRDEILPEVLEQLDMLASRLRDTMNLIHNNGSSFPGRNSLTGTREVVSGDISEWSGSVRIAALKNDGQPVPAVYADESYTGFRPLTLNLSQLNAGQGAGRPDVQTIIDEINNHFGAPSFKAKLGAMNNIQIASQSDFLPNGADPNFRFDLDLENISNDNARVFVTGFTVLDAGSVNITNVTQGAPVLALDPANTFSTTLGSNNVLVQLAAPPTNVGVGSTIFLGPPAGPINGLTPAQLSGFFQVTSVSGNTLGIQVTGAPATATGVVGDAVAYAQPPYDTVLAGDKRRTTNAGQLALDFSGNLASAFYDVSLNVAVVDKNNNIAQSTITYRINNNQQNMRNDRFDNTAMSAGSRVPPNTSQPTLRAILVDADGNELPKLNGRYQSDVGVLKIVGNTDDIYIAIDELSSKHLGLSTGTTTTATQRQFSHYFGLNNFFVDPIAYNQTDTLKNSAVDLAVDPAIIANPNLISTGQLERQTQPANPSSPAQYTYVRYIGNNKTAQAIGGLASRVISFDSAGGLAQSQITLGTYAGEFLGRNASVAAAATGAYQNDEMLLNGYTERAKSISGVNLDEELANTITFQNAYAANAKVITTVNGLFDDLLNAFR